MTAREPFASIDELFDALAAGARAFDEPGLDVLSHSLQCADLLRDDVELAVAGLVHDVWDAVAPGDHTDHDRRGAALVEPLLGERVARLVAGHVQAKRYLVAVDPNYGPGLSDRSVVTLEAQGERMTGDEVRAFEASDLFGALVTLRRADERAKVIGADVSPLDTWRAVVTPLARL